MREIQSTVKLPTKFVDEIKTAAEQEYRSASQQLLYWAKIGQRVTQLKDKINEDEEIGRHAIEIFKREQHLIKKVNIDDL